MTQAIEPIPSREPGDMPAWLATIIIILALGGGGGLAWWYFKSPTTTVAVPLSASPRPDTEMRQRNAQQRREQRDWNNDIRPINNGGFLVRAGTVQMWVRNVDGKLTASGVTYRDALLSANEMAMLRAPVLAGIEDEVKRLNFTPEQVTKLRGLRPPRNMVATAEERKSVTDAWDAYNTAPDGDKSKRKDELLGLMNNLGAKNLEATKGTLAETAKKIRETLTPEQQQKLETNQ